MLGLTATIGIGDAISLESAKEYIIGMCAKVGLVGPPSESLEVVQGMSSTQEEEYDTVSGNRGDKLSMYIQRHLMQPLEEGVVKKCKSPHPP